MIEIKVKMDINRPLSEQLDAIRDFFLPNAQFTTAPLPDVRIVVAEDSHTVAEISTVEVTEEPKRRTRVKKETAKKAATPVIDIPPVDEQDVADEQSESNATLTHDDVRAAVGAYTKKFGIVAAQKRIPEIIGCAIADVPDDEHSLRRAIFQIEEAMIDDENPMFDDGPVEPEVTEQDVREAMMLYAKKYDGTDTKMPNTLIDGADILKRTFGPTVMALRLIPKDPASLKKAYTAIHDAIENNPYNRKVIQ